ncbi:unnamed protein product [Scytosiphon promiscuus]
MSSACLFDGGRDGFLARSTSKPPSKFDSIEFLERDDKSCITSKRSVTSSKKNSGIIADSELGGRSIGRSVHSARSTSSSNATAMGAWSWGDGNSSRANTEATQTASSWKAEVSGRSTCSKPLTAPLFFWGPKVTRPGQEAAREIRRTNTGDPATFALTVDKCPSTVPAIRSLVPRRFHSTTAGSSIDDPTKLIDGPSSAYEGLEPYIRTSITDRVHDGIYDTDVAHKSTLGGRIKRGEVLSPEIFRGGKRFAEAIAAPGPQKARKLDGPGPLRHVAGHRRHHMEIYELLAISAGEVQLRLLHPRKFRPDDRCCDRAWKVRVEAGDRQSTRAVGVLQHR